MINGSNLVNFLMTEIIENKCAQVQQFREKLRSVEKNTVFAESTINDQWGTGLDKVGTENTKRSEWPGQNSLGQIIGKVAQKMRKRKKATNGVNPSKIQGNKRNKA